MIGHKPMTSTIKSLQKSHLDLWESYDIVSIGDNCYFIIIIDNNIKKMWTCNVMFKDMFFLIFKI